MKPLGEWVHVSKLSETKKLQLPSTIALRVGRSHRTRVPVMWSILTPNPNKCTHYLRAISTKIEIISTTIAVTTENSADLSSGRRPVSKSVEFAVVTAMVVEI